MFHLTRIFLFLFLSGEYIDIKAKVGYEKLQPLLPSPIFSQLPVISAKCKGKSFLVSSSKNDFLMDLVVFY